MFGDVVQTLPTAYLAKLWQTILTRCVDSQTGGHPALMMIISGQTEVLCNAVGAFWGPIGLDKLCFGPCRLQQPTPPEVRADYG